ncbi:MAG: hypothetical protein RJA98_1089 [Pseudomonadota bacterium]|jgi:type IV pilus modification protein PilV
MNDRRQATVAAPTPPAKSRHRCGCCCGNLHRQRQRHHPVGHSGTSLLEVLVSLLVLAVGLLGLAKWQVQGRHEADIARQRSEATRLAQEDLETARAYASVQAAAASGAPSFDALGSRTATSQAEASPNTEFTLQRQAPADAALPLKWPALSVAWADHQGGSQDLQLATALAAIDPAWSGALVVQNARQRTPGRGGRAPGLPPISVRKLGDGRSAFKPSSDATVAWVADTVTGQILSVCDNGIQAMQQVDDIPAALLTDCHDAPGQLLTGLLRWSLAVPPSLNAANDLPLALQMKVQTTGGPYPAAPVCVSEAKKLVRFNTAVGPTTVEVPLLAEPGFLGQGAWTALGERYVRYLCLVSPAGTPPSWSGRSTVLPQGWGIGTAATQYKVCRITTDLDGSGAIDHNDEHPSSYSAVDSLLSGQNFLVIRGDQGCPGAAAAGPTGALTPASSTVQHQP